MDELPDQKYKGWYIMYGDFEELLPKVAHLPLGNKVTTITEPDARP
jgi:hypothetical protein